MTGRPFADVNDWPTFNGQSVHPYLCEVNEEDGAYYLLGLREDEKESTAMKVEWKRTGQDSVEVTKQKELWQAIDNILNAEGPAEFSAAYDELGFVREEQKPKWLK